MDGFGMRAGAPGPRPPGLNASGTHDRPELRQIVVVSLAGVLSAAIGFVEAMGRLKDALLVSAYARVPYGGREVLLTLAMLRQRPR